MHYARQGKYLVLTGEYVPRNIMKHVQASKFRCIRGAVRKSRCNTELPVIRESKDQLNLSSRCNEINTGVFESICHRSHTLLLLDQSLLLFAHGLSIISHSTSLRAFSHDTLVRFMTGISDIFS